MAIEMIKWMCWEINPETNFPDSSDAEHNKNSEIHVNQADQLPTIVNLDLVA